MRLLIGGSSTFLVHLKQLSYTLNSLGVESKLVFDGDYADGLGPDGGEAADFSQGPADVARCPHRRESANDPSQSDEARGPDRRVPAASFTIA